MTRLISVTFLVSLLASVRAMPQSLYVRLSTSEMYPKVKLGRPACIGSQQLSSAQTDCMVPPALTDQAVAASRLESKTTWSSGAAAVALATHDCIGELG
eukprot:TRINITY_DN8792_c0_g1_i1.p1 TRINITY_DN8792_c0_g1~~TRINITY_DN8792_c0_g1_i1.p1  ORF type:complete len:112 (+),score=10.67 TRINITY_DN8792_c0_g1_i1:41-337(+)